MPDHDEIRQRVDRMLASQLAQLRDQWWRAHEDDKPQSIKDAADSALWEFMEQVAPLMGTKQES
jgi:hypothetical protein